MKFIHTGDLHIGRSLHGFDLLEDQRHILSQILGIARAERADGLLLAGDIYDRSVPSAAAVRLFDDFLTAVYEAGMDCYLISGNHDSGERLSFAGRILEQKNIYIGSSWKQGPSCVCREDAWGQVCVWLLPFVRPAAVSEQTMQGAMEALLREAKPGPGARHVLVAHAFVTDGERPPLLSDSEQTVSVGGLDSVSADVFAAFDYTALGHLHAPQRVGSGQVWYAGSPLKYSFSESLQQKSVQVVELRGKGEVLVEQRPLTPLRDVLRLKGTLKELLSKEVRALVDPGAYICAALTDEEELPDPLTALRDVYPNVCEVVRMKHLTDGMDERETADLLQRKTDEQLFEEFYEKVTGQPLDEAHRAVARWMLEEAGEEE